MVKVRKDLSGKRFGRLVVLEQAEDYIKPNGVHEARWLCKCDCGNTTNVSSNSLTSNRTKSCGCLKLEKSIARANIYFKDTGKLINKKYNQFDLSGGCGIGHTTKGEKFIFDKEDYDLIKNFCWYLNDSGYLLSRYPDSGKKVRIHRLIMKCENDKTKIIDHINHNKLDNRKCNLRIVSYQQNAMNTKMKDVNTSGFVGVSFDKEKNKWLANITYNYNTIFLGYYSNIDDAVNARKQAEEDYFGNYSYDNSMKNSKQNLIRSV